MSTTVTGAILLLLGAFALFRAPHRLGQLTLFFVPFTSTATLIYTGGSSGHWLPAVNWFLLCWMLARLPHWVLRGTLQVPRGAALPLAALGVFTLIAAISLLIPMWIDGRVSITAAALLTEEFGNAYPLRFGTHQALVGLDLLYGVLLTALVAGAGAGRSGFDRMAGAAFAGVIFAASWGLLEFLLPLAGLTYPSAVFNSNPSEGVGGEAGRLLRSGVAEVRRLRSVGLEPSILAKSLLATLPLATCMLWARQPILSRRLDRLTVALGITCLLLSGSGLGLIGVGLMTVVCFLLVAGRRVGLAPYLLFAGFLATVGIAYASSQTVRAYIDLFIIQKPLSDSGLERAYMTLNAWGYFLRYPILGLGWGSVPSADLVVLLLSNVGVVGFAAFVVVLAVLWRALRAAASRARDDREAELRIVGCLASLIVCVTMAAIGRFSYEHAHVWLVLGLAMASLSLAPEPAA